jgi:trk/ktr system potassium uptake protein
MRVIIGGGKKIGMELALKLLKSNHDIILIDKNQDICDRVYKDLGIVAIQGNITNIEILKEAELDKADLVVAATGNDTDNLAFAILAKSFGVPQIIVPTHNPAYENAYRLAGATSVVRVTDLVVNHLIMEIEHPRARNISSIGGGRANVFVVIIPPKARVIGKSVKEIVENQKFPNQCNFIAVYNAGTDAFAIPRGEQIIKANDEIYLISPADFIKMAVNILTAEKK